MPERNALNANKSIGGRTTGGIARAFRHYAPSDFEPEITYTRGYLYRTTTRNVA